MRKRQRFIVFILVLVLIVPLFISATSILNLPKKTQAADYNKAQSLANETGISVNKILDWYEESKDWNQVITLANQQSKKGEDLSNQLVDMDQLKDQYTKAVIEEASNLIEMTQFKIDEILNFEKDEGIFNTYQQLKEKLQTEEALYWTLTLKEQLDTLEKALDEYLIAMQLEINLNRLLEDEEAYHQEKTDQKLQYKAQLITLETIEQTLLEALAKMNQQDNITQKEETTDLSTQPNIEVKIPEAESPMPIDPREALQQEIDALLPKE